MACKCKDDSDKDFLDSGIDELQNDAVPDYASQQQHLKGGKSKPKSKNCSHERRKSADQDKVDKVLSRIVKSKFNINIERTNSTHSGDIYKTYCSNCGHECHHNNSNSTDDEVPAKDLSQIVVDDTVIMTIRECIDENWMKLGEQLMISATKLNEIRGRHCAQSFAVKRMAYEMLQLWKKNLRKEATLDKLINALNDLGERKLVAKITPDWCQLNL